MEPGGGWIVVVCWLQLKMEPVVVGGCGVLKMIQAGNVLGCVDSGQNSGRQQA